MNEDASVAVPAASSLKAALRRPPVGLAASNLTLSRERTYFGCVLAISILCWGALAVTLVGLFYALAIGFFLWIANGLFTAYLRAEAVRISERQLPELHRAFGEVCDRFGLRQRPELYVLQSGGALNAFATRFVGRDFVVVFSDLLEALGPDSAEMRFILGHEIGHIRSNHLLKRLLLAPGLIFPLAGPAYARATESSCDRHGAFAAGDADASVRAMMLLGGGRAYGPRLDAGAFAGQHREERGFFVSLHELTSDYPTLSRRVTDLLALADGVPGPAARRHPLAYACGLLIFGGPLRSGGPAGALVMLVFLGFLAAMAIPAFTRVRAESQVRVCLDNLRQVAAAIDQYQLEHEQMPGGLKELVGPDAYLLVAPVCPEGGDYKLPPDAEYGAEVFCTLHGTMEDIAAGEGAPYPAGPEY